MAGAHILVVLATGLLLAGLVSLWLGPRGGRYRALPGWALFWALFGALLVVISRAPALVSLPMLGFVVFATLREYFFLAPLRPADRWAIMFAYFSIPLCLYAVFVDRYGLFLTTVLLALFLLMPAVLTLATGARGLLESMGRVLLAVLVFLFCAIHLAWMHHRGPGFPELYGALVLAAELPQRIAGRLRLGRAGVRPWAGVIVGLVLACGLAAWLGPWQGVGWRRAVAGATLVAISVTVGGMVTEAVAEDLGLDSAAARVGRAALLDRIVPAIYAAPLYYHLLARAT